VKRSFALFALCALAGGATGCAALRGFKDRLGFVSNAPATAAQGPAEKKKPDTNSAFPTYLFEAFPDARYVRIDPQSPSVSLAAESNLTVGDPHRRRGAPRFSPDGRLVAYAERERGGGDRRLILRRLDGVIIRSVSLEAARADGANAAPIDALPRELTPITFAPSSDAFAFTRETTLGAFEVVMADLAGEPRKLIGPPAVDGSAEWSPDSSRIAYVPSTRPEEIWTADVGTRIATRLATAPAPIQSFSWSADSARMVLSCGNEEHDIWTFDVALAGKPEAFRRITHWSFDDVSPSFSPDGRWIAFYSTYRPLATVRGHALFVVSGDGSDPSSGAALIDHVRSAVVEVHDATPPPSWSPDSKWIAVAEPLAGGDEYHAVVLVEANRVVRHELAPDTVTNEDVAVSADGVLAYRARLEWGDQIVLGLTAKGATRVEK
jgi:Tol biopolymer transport system component